MEMKALMEIVQAPYCGIVHEQTRSQTDLSQRVFNIAEHLCRHLVRVTADELSTVFNDLDSITVAHSIDCLFESVKSNNTPSIIDNASNVYNLIGHLNEAEIAGILGCNYFKGEEYDVYGLIRALGNALSTHSGHLTESAHSGIIDDLVSLASSWDEPYRSSIFNLLASHGFTKDR